MVWPLSALKEIFFNKYSSASGYLKETFLNSTVPVSVVLPSKSPSFRELLVSRTLLIR